MASRKARSSTTTIAIMAILVVCLGTLVLAAFVVGTRPLVLRSAVVASDSSIPSKGEEDEKHDEPTSVCAC